MARSSWKGNTLIYDIYKQSNIRYIDSTRSWIFSKLKDISILPPIKLHRRSQFISSSLVALDLKFKIYNGYDFFIKKLDLGQLSLNLGSLVLTRESKVVHKTKLSKEARRNQQLKLSKKKPLASKKK